MHPKRFLEGSFASSLHSAINVDQWGMSVNEAGAINPTNILLSHKDILISEILAVTSRLTWLAFTPSDWKTLRSSERIDKIIEIICSTTNLDRSKAIEIAYTLNEILSAYQEVRSNKHLTHSELLRLVDESNRRCYLCGRPFSNEQVINFLDRKPYKAMADRSLVDKWKPIYKMHQGWCIDIDHCLPISGSGSDTIENYRLSCHYCNNIKRDFISIFDASLNLIKSSKSMNWKFHVLRLISNGSCYECGVTAKASELTVACHNEEALPTIQNFFVTCYEHDPQSKNRFSVSN
jgi:hypothetical protein